MINALLCLEGCIPLDSKAESPGAPTKTVTGSSLAGLVKGNAWASAA